MWSYCLSVVQEVGALGSRDDRSVQLRSECLSKTESELLSGWWVGAMVCRGSRVGSGSREVGEARSGDGASTVEVDSM